MIGATFSHFRVTAKLGEGGMGEVYRAEDTKLGRDVAIKVLPEAVAADPERLARFEREAKVLASLNHPNIAAIYSLERSTVTSAEGSEAVKQWGSEQRDGTGREEGASVPQGPNASGPSSVHFLVMELVAGEDLSQQIARGPIPVSKTLSVAQQLADALEVAHELGIIHRDLKPANIKVTPDGQVKVLDFGLAKALDPETGTGTDQDPIQSPMSMSPTLTAQMTQAGVLLGTAAYMSPEQAKGRVVDKRSDIWSYGVVLWEMLTGRDLFEGETVPERLGAIFRQEIDLGELPLETPLLLRRLIERCLERDPKRRLRDIGEARVAIERIIEGEEASIEETLSKAPPEKSPSRWVPIGVTGVLCALLAAGAVYLLEPAPPPEPVRKLDLVAEGVDAAWFTAPTLSPAGRSIAYNAKGGIWVRDLDDLVARQLVTVSEPSAIFWSPDSASLGYADGKKLWRVDAGGGRSTAICDLPGTGAAIGGAWRDDGTIAFASWRGAMYSVSAEGGHPTEMFEHDPQVEIDYHFPSWLPDGRLLFAAHRNLDEPTRSGDGSAPRSGAALEEMKLDVFDGSERRAIEWGGSVDLQWPTFDPRSRLLLYTRTMPSIGIWARPMEAASLAPIGDEYLLTPDAGTLSLGGDDSLLYMEVESIEGSTELVWIDRSGRVLGGIAAPMAGLAEPALSPDGRRLAATAWTDGNRDVWMIDLERGASSRLTFEDSHESVPMWDADTDRIIYSELRGMSSTIVTRAADGSGDRQELVQGAGYGMWGGLAAYSPDGRHLLFAVDEGGPKYLRLSEVGENGAISEPEPFFSSSPEPSILDARISPDGRLLAYMSTDSGQPEVFLTRFPEGTGRWQVSNAGGSQPRWAAGSGELFFIGGSGPTSRMLTSVDLGTGPEIAIGVPEQLFSLSDNFNNSLKSEEGFDVAADGSRFVMVRSSSSGVASSPRMILVQNWRQELSDR